MKEAKMALIEIYVDCNHVHKPITKIWSAKKRELEPRRRPMQARVVAQDPEKTELVDKRLESISPWYHNMFEAG